MKWVSYDLPSQDGGGILIKSMFKKSSNQQTQVYTINQKSDRGIVVKLMYYDASMCGCFHYVDVSFSDGNKIRIFSPEWIEFMDEV